MAKHPKVYPQWARIGALVEALKEAAPGFEQWWHTKHIPSRPDQTGRVWPARDVPDTSNPIMVEVEASELNWILHEVVKCWAALPASQMACQWEGMNPGLWMDIRRQVEGVVEQMMNWE